MMLSINHHEVCEVDDCDGCCDEEITSVVELLCVQQRRQCKGDRSSKSAVWQDELIYVVEPR